MTVRVRRTKRHAASCGGLIRMANTPRFNRLGFYFSTALAALILAGCSRNARPAAAPDGAAQLTKVSLQTDWYAEPEHGGFYLALVKGYYREVGLDVEIRQGGPNAVPPQRVATGIATFGMGRSDDVEIAAGHGVPIVMVGALMQRDPQAIMFHRESGIHTFKDLDGRNIMAVPGSPFIPIMEQTFHIKVAVTPLDFGLSRFMADKNFVQQCFITNEPFYVQRAGANVGTLLLSDTGFSPYRVWFAKQSFIAEHPDIVRAFTAASIRGWRDYIAGDNAEADARITALNPKMEPEFMAYSEKAMRDFQLVTGDPAKGEAVGQIVRSRLEQQLKQLAEMNQLERPVTVDEVFDPRFLPAEVMPAGASK
jgi:NitT/TauT family transport system substrate-binding protein